MSTTRKTTKPPAPHRLTSGDLAAATTDPTPVEMALDAITRDERFQQRDINPEIAAGYVEHYEAGVAMPPLEVMHVDDAVYLIDGWHRDLAMQLAGITTAEVILRHGTVADAYAAAARANATHGLPRGRLETARALRLALRSIGALDEATFRQRFHRDDPSRTGPKLDGWTLPDVAAMIGVSTTTAWRYRDAALKTISGEMGLLIQQREAGFAQRMREAERERRAQAEAEAAMEAAADALVGTDSAEAEDMAAIHEAFAAIETTTHEARSTKPPAQARMEAEYEARRLVSIASATVRDLLALPPEAMAEAWVLVNQQDDGVVRIREMGERLLAYADAMAAARPETSRVVT